VEDLIGKLSADMHMLFGSLKERMDKLETGLEQRISNKVSQLLDKRMHTELNRIRDTVDTKFEELQESVHSEFASELDDIKAKVNQCSAGSSSRDIALNVVIREMPEGPRENVVNKVNSLIRDGLKVSDVTCASAERKKSPNSSKPGVIIARFKSHDDKRKVMAEKSKLKGHRQFDGVFLHHDQSHADRMMSSNFRTIISALNRSDLSVNGSRVIHKPRHSGSQQSQNTRDRSAGRANDHASSDNGSFRSTNNGWSTVGNGRNNRSQNSRPQNNRQQNTRRGGRGGRRD